jgi:hypothetical protein
MQAPLAFDLPCSWAPLQSLTAAASRDSRTLGPSAILRGAKSPAASFALLRTRSRVARPKTSNRASVTAPGQAPFGSEAGSLEARDTCAESRGSRNLRSPPRAAPKDDAHASISRRASPILGPKPVSWRLLVTFPSTEAELLATRPPFGFHGRSCGGRQGTLESVCDSSDRSLSPRAPGSRELPPNDGSPKWLADARHAAWDIDDSSLEVRPPSASLPGRSLRQFASPTPSALRVSHPLSGLIPPWPRGSVSCHIRPWGFVTAFRAFPTQPAVTPLGARCSLAVPASLGSPRASSSWAFAPAVGYPYCLPLPALAATLARASPKVNLDISRTATPPKRCRSRRAAETASGVIAQRARRHADGS